MPNHRRLPVHISAPMLCPAAGLLVALVSAWASGCRPAAAPPPDALELRRAAVAVLTDALDRPAQDVSYPSPAGMGQDKADMTPLQLKSQALEVLADFPELVQSQWLTQSLDSGHDGIKYSALLTIGRLADYQGGRLSRPFLARAQTMAAENAPPGREESDVVRLAAGFVLFKLTGDPRYVGGVTHFLTLKGASPQEIEDLAKLRAETLYVLSLIPRLQPQALLREFASRDPNVGVQVMAKARLAILGDKQATDEVINLAQSPHADDQRDALAALGEARLDNLDPVRQLLTSPRQPAEVKMAAARTLGMHHDASGQALALRWLNYRVPEKIKARAPQRDFRIEEYRVCILAALALGSIGNYDQSAGPLLNMIKSSSSKRSQLAAARAALELLRRSGRWAGGESVPARPSTDRSPGFGGLGLP